MTDFRTTISPPDYSFGISHHDHILSIGSCFSDNIGSRLINRKFPCLLNPFGILYNPVSIGQNLLQSLEGYEFQHTDIFQHGDHWHSFHHPGQFSQLSQEEILSVLQKTALEVQSYLQKTNRILCTLGSSMVYEHKGFGGIVANCHKLPAEQFIRRRLGLEEIVESLAGPFRRIKEMNAGLEVVITVSPVRHGRDGMHVNQKSKALLLLACEALCERLDFVHYFPAYELQLDDLRDYRFYKPDMLHPSETAIDYIWNYFGKCLFSKATKEVSKQILQIGKSIHHRPLRPGTPAHEKFIRSGIKRIKDLEAAYPFLSFDKERNLFEGQLSEYF